MIRCSNKNCRIEIERAGYCRGCAAEYRKAWVAAHPGYVTQKRKEWAQKNPERARELDRRKYERWKAKQPSKPPRPAPLTDWERKKRHLERNPIKAACYKIYKYAVRHGKLLRGPCHVCGATEGIDGHHTDYTKPLDVLWLCKVHHREMHKQQIND